jgi:hypothetical protein
MDALASHGRGIVSAGRGFGQTGADVNSTWQALAGVYHAPEQEVLFSAMRPVEAVAGQLGDNAAVVGRAVEHYAGVVRPIQARLEQLRAQAGQLVSEIHAYASQDHSKMVPVMGAHGTRATFQPSDDWHDDEDLVDRNNALIGEVDQLVAQWEAAQRACANAINALDGGTHYRASNADGQHATGEFGYTASMLNRAAHTGQGLPWGSAEEAAPGPFDQVGGFLHGLWDSASGMVMGIKDMVVHPGQTLDGLGTLVGLHGWGKAGAAWTHFGKSMIAWDEWSKNPARAFGQSLFNIGIMFVPGVDAAKVAGKFGRVGEAVADTGRAGKAAELAAKAGRVAKGVGKAVDRIPTVDEIAKGLRRKFPHLHLPTKLDPAIAHLGDHPGNLPGTPQHPLEPNTAHMTGHSDGSAGGGGSGTDGRNGGAPRDGAGDRPKLIRQDDDFHSLYNHKGQRKTHLDASGDLVPANPHGDTTIVQHIVGKGQAKSDSPYTSFSQEGADAKLFGHNHIRVDLSRLEHDIATGKVHDLSVYSPEQIQNAIQYNADRIAGRHVDLSLPPDAMPRSLV